MDQRVLCLQVPKDLQAEEALIHPILTEAWHGQKIGYSCETLITTLFQAWLGSRVPGPDRIEAVKKALELKGLSFQGNSTWEA